MNANIRVYIFSLWSSSAKYELESLEMENATTQDVLDKIDSWFESDCEYYDYNMSWEYIPLVKDELYACVVESDDFNKPVMDGEYKFYSLIRSELDVISNCRVMLYDNEIGDRCCWC